MLRQPELWWCMTLQSLTFREWDSLGFRRHTECCTPVSHCGPNALLDCVRVFASQVAIPLRGKSVVVLPEGGSTFSIMQN